MTKEMVAKSVVCGPDPEPYRAKIEAYIAAEFTHVCFHQVGTDLEGFFAYAERELLPHDQDGAEEARGISYAHTIRNPR